MRLLSILLLAFCFISTIMQFGTALSYFNYFGFDAFPVSAIMVQIVTGLFSIGIKEI